MCVLLMNIQEISVKLSQSTKLPVMAHFLLGSGPGMWELILKHRGSADLNR